MIIVDLLVGKLLKQYLEQCHLQTRQDWKLVDVGVQLVRRPSTFFVEKCMIICIVQDIVCKYWPWVRNKEHLFPGSMDMIPCLSVMHGKAHSWPCEVCNFVHAIFSQNDQKCFRLSGVVDGKMVPQVGQEKTWSNFFLIYQDGHFQQKC